MLDSERIDKIVATKSVVWVRTVCYTSRAMRNRKRIILVAGMGTSPAVLTETVWALAHQEKPVVPDEITVLTTSSGKVGLCEALFSGAPSVWDKLKAALRKGKIKTDGKLKFSEHLVKVMLDEDGQPMDDLRIGEDNMRAADFMLRELRSYTEEPDTTVLCSIAGGRKTMSALLFSCMTLLGREEDKVYHVLIPPEYECGMSPKFYFPQKGETHELLDKGTPTGKKVSSTKIGIELFEVPFVRMRGWYQEKFKTIPPSYSTLVSRMQTMAPAAAVYPEIEIDAVEGNIKMDGSDVRLSATCFAALCLLAQGRHGTQLHQDLISVHRSPGGTRYDWLATFKEGSRFSSESAVEDLNKVLSELRKKLSAAGFANVESLVPQRGRAPTFPPARIKWINREKMADVCGCLFPDAAK